MRIFKSLKCISKGFKVVLFYVSISFSASAYADYHAAPYLTGDGWTNLYCGPQPTISAALACMKEGVVARWGSHTSSCPYRVKYFPDGPITGKFASYNFSNFEGSSCGGGNAIIGTRYTGTPPTRNTQKTIGASDCLNLNGNPCDASCSNLNGNPCDASTGNKFQTEIDYSSNTLNFIRYFNSLYDTQSVLGRKWTHNYLASLTIAETIQINRPDGKVLVFFYDGFNWVSDGDITETLTQIGSLWEYKTNHDTIETYNETGQLLTIQTRDGKSTHFTYNANNLLEQVTGPYGRTLDFAYDTSNRLITLTTPENTQLHYTYDVNANHLLSVTYPDSTPDDLSNNPQKSYHYEDVRFQHYLTGITDENGVRYASWAYNEAGLAILSEHANSTEKVELIYNDNETTTVTDALGRVKTYTFEAHYGLRKPKTIQYSYNDGSLNITKSKTYTYYPENGRVKEVTDYNGNITYYEYNTRGLITLETQAKGTPEEYSVTTTWHPDYRLPATRNYPDITVNYEYGTNGLLTKTHILENP